MRTAKCDAHVECIYLPDIGNMKLESLKSTKQRTDLSITSSLLHVFCRPNFSNSDLFLSFPSVWSAVQLNLPSWNDEQQPTTEHEPQLSRTMPPLVDDCEASPAPPFSAKATHPPPPSSAKPRSSRLFSRPSHEDDSKNGKNEEDARLASLITEDANWPAWVPIEEVWMSGGLGKCSDQEKTEGSKRAGEGEEGNARSSTEGEVKAENSQGGESRSNKLGERKGEKLERGVDRGEDDDDDEESVSNLTSREEART